LLAWVNADALELLDQPAGALAVGPLANALGDHRPHTLNILEDLRAFSGGASDRASRLPKRSAKARAATSPTWRIPRPDQQASQRLLPGGSDRFQQLLRLALGEFLKARAGLLS
jgi:hypothetical protein